jgi:hypothetical protein
MTDTTDSRIENEAEASKTYAAVLVTEDADEFASMRDELEQEIMPKGFIERMYVADIATILWEILRLRRFKIAIINHAFRPALAAILKQCLDDGDIFKSTESESKAELLAHQWFHNQAVKKEVAKLLRKNQLDEHAISAEAFRQASSDLERIDRLLTLAETRRDRALRNISDYRFGFAQRVRQSSDRVLAGDKVLSIEHPWNRN